MFFLRKLHGGSWIIPNITYQLPSRTELSEVNCSRVFLLLCSLYHAEVSFSLSELFYSFHLLISVLLRFSFFSFFYLKEILLGDRICKVFMLKYFPDLKISAILLRFEGPHSMYQGCFLVFWWSSGHMPCPVVTAELCF